jgi:hypothetical protein
MPFWAKDQTGPDFEAPVRTEIRLITGQHAEETVFIPQIGITSSETQIPFEFC